MKVGFYQAEAQGLTKKEKGEKKRIKRKIKG